MKLEEMKRIANARTSGRWTTSHRNLYFYNQDGSERRDIDHLLRYEALQELESNNG